MKDWLTVAISLGAALLLLAFGRGLTDDPTPVEVTIVPDDVRGLACAGEAGGATCAFNRDGSGREPRVERPLRPFVTTGGRLVLLRGLFEQEAVQRWLAAQHAPNERARVRCEARRLESGARVGVRFTTNGAFEGKRADVADVDHCTL